MEYWISNFFLDQCTDWYYWLMALNSIMNPWIYLSLNRDLQASLYHCCCPCFKPKSSQTSSNENIVLAGDNQNLSASVASKHNFLMRPRSFTASQAQQARGRLRMRPFCNNSYQRRESSYMNNDIPKMRCRLNTFQLWNIYTSTFEGIQFNKLAQNFKKEKFIWDQTFSILTQLGSTKITLLFLLSCLNKKSSQTSSDENVV